MLRRRILVIIIIREQAHRAHRQPARQTSIYTCYTIGIFKWQHRMCHLHQISWFFIIKCLWMKMMNTRWYDGMGVWRVCVHLLSRALPAYFLLIFSSLSYKITAFKSLFGCKQLTILNCILFAYNLKSVDLLSWGKCAMISVFFSSSCSTDWLRRVYSCLCIQIVIMAQHCFKIR